MLLHRYLHKAGLFFLVVFLNLLHCSLTSLSQEVIRPLIVTEPVLYDADDPAIWLNKKNPAKSLIIGTDKSSTGALFVYNMQGKILSDKVVRNLKRPNNVDVAYGMRLNGGEVDIAVTTERETSRLRIFSVPDMQPIDSGGIPVFEGEPFSEYRMPMGIALYTDPVTKDIYAVVSRKSGPTNGTYLWQYLLRDDGQGHVTGTLVRKFGKFSGKKEIESVAVDNELGYIYYSDEGVGVRKYYADTTKGNEELALFMTTGFVQDHEGISIYKLDDGTGYILVSDQQANEFHIFPREGTPDNPHDHPLLKVIKVAAHQSDGSETVNYPIMPDFPNGLFVAMSDDKTFHMYRWEDIAGSDLKIQPPAINIPSAPIVVAPLDSAWGVELSPTLTWSAVPGATGYRMQLSRAANFSKPLADREVTGDTTARVYSLLQDSAYYWRVAALTEEGNSAWSPGWTFTTGFASGPLVGRWNMEEGGGTTLVDVSGHGNDAAIQGQPEWIDFGAGRALRLNGVDQYATVKDRPSLQISKTLTLAAWVRPEQTATQYIIKKAAIDKTDGYELSLSNTGKVFFRINQASAGNQYRVTSDIPYPVDSTTWMHIAATYDGTALKLYINGVEEKVLTVPDSVSIHVNTEDLAIGAEVHGLHPFKGALDEVRVYDTVLSAAEIGELANISRQYLVGNWKMEEGGGTRLVDASEYQNHGSIKGEPLWLTGKEGLGLQLNGRDQYAAVPDTPSLNPKAAMTLAAWIRPEKHATQYIIKKAKLGTANGYELSLSSTGKVFFRLNEADSANVYRVNSTRNYPADSTTWMHVAATYDGVVMKLYINGVEDTSLIPAIPPTLSANDLPLTIGAQSDWAGKFQGTLDEVRVYCTALSAAEIADLAGASVVTEVLPKVEADSLSVYPNPVTSTAVARFTLEQSGAYTLDLFDFRGVRMAELKRGKAAAGVVNTVKVQRSALPVGLYILRLRTARGVKTQKLALMD